MAKQFDRQTKSRTVVSDQERIVGCISALIRAEHRHAAYLAQRHELTSADNLALYHLADQPLRSRELADRLGLTPGSVTALVDRLVARDLARRVPHATDRRIVLIEMTDSGRAEAWSVLQYFIGDVIALGASRSARDAAVIVHFLNDLIEVVDRDTARLQQHDS
jgi:DNA-binding MarR family transcriptional regulator